jgi:hypothetical protein
MAGAQASDIAPTRSAFHPTDGRLATVMETLVASVRDQLSVDAEDGPHLHVRRDVHERTRMSR